MGLDKNESNRRFDFERNKLSIEPRYYAGLIDKEVPWFTGIEFFRIDETFIKTNDRYRMLQTDQIFSFDTANVSRKINGIALKGGTQLLVLKRRLAIEPSLGIGYRFVRTEYDREVNLAELTMAERTWFEIIRIGIGEQFEGSRSGIHLSYHVRIGYRLF